ncbi:hypothetical protein AVEN_156887-1 [Araneus ventricosus]|uniref:RNA-directed DNA polymerase n=1 Tax=Araneus ventricosus TaxID=182803 RepID=A0A4Y2ELF3_ARAVE|nr:hypothetical protein AVEN_156887-1 [Araneus ventricosus]
MIPTQNKHPEEGLKVSALSGWGHGLYLTATCEKAKIHGKLDASIECRSRKFQHRIYVADITDYCILGLDFLQIFKIKVDLEKNEIRTGSEKFSLFSVYTQYRQRISDGTDVLSRRLCVEGCEPCSSAEKKFRMETDISVEALAMTTENRWSLNGVLYRKWESNDGGFYRRKLIIPKSRIQEVLREIHDNTSGRHFGVIETLRKIRERFHWDRRSADVEKWYRECQTCGARKGSKTEQGESVTGRTPAEMFSDLILRYSPINSEASLKSVKVPAGEQVKLTSQRMKTRYDSRAKDHHFKGDLIRMYNPKRRRGPSPKLQQNWEGPYTLVKKLNDVVYRVQSSPNAKPKVIHINRLASYRATDDSSK